MKNRFMEQDFILLVSSVVPRFSCFLKESEDNLHHLVELFWKNPSIFSAIHP